MSFVMRVVHENTDGTVIQRPWGVVCDGCGACVMDHLHVGGKDFCRKCEPVQGEPERFHTQGGGVVEWDSLQRAYVFVEDAPAGYSVGDRMPEEWGIA